MKLLRVAFALGLVAGNISLPAQVPLIPFDQIARDGQDQQKAASAFIAAIHSEGNSSSRSAATPGMITSPRTSAAESRVADRKFLLLNGVHLGMAMFDIGLTQHCIANHQCKEGNPLMPSSMAGQVSVTLGVFAFSAGGSYYLKKHGAKSWWIPSLSGTVAHTAGAASGLAH